jgi:signal transduction histidine kinase
VYGIKSAIKRMQPLIEEKNIVLLMSLPDHEVKIKFNDDKFLQVILNLMSNAIKFCDPEKGKISLSLEEFDEKILVKVNNNGAVIPEEFLRRIFEKFTQYKQGNIAKPEGSGLGLYITKKFVEEMGGTVSIESSLNHGTTFSLTLHL